jgi:hypothetical protein
VGIVVLGPRDSLVGTLTVDGDVRIEGTLEGEVSATGEVSVQSSGSARAPMSPSGDAPPARRMEEHDQDGTVDVTGSPVSAEGDHGAYGEESAGSESDAYSDERAAETSAVSSGSDSEVG